MLNWHPFCKKRVGIFFWFSLSFDLHSVVIFAVFLNSPKMCDQQGLTTNFQDIDFFAILFHWFWAFRQIDVICLLIKTNLWIVPSKILLLCWRWAQVRKFRIVPVSVGLWYHLQETFLFINVSCRIQETDIVIHVFHPCRLLMCKICHLHIVQIVFDF